MRCNYFPKGFVNVLRIPFVSRQTVYYYSLNESKNGKTAVTTYREIHACQTIHWGRRKFSYV
jgi:hypothetical protein